jgi:hypothetical protein
MRIVAAALTMLFVSSLRADITSVMVGDNHGFGFGAAGLASAASITTAIFSGVCTADCTGLASATLTLQDYTPGDAIGLPNFVSFSYVSTFLGTVNVTDATGIAGSIGAAPGPYGFALNDSNNIQFHTFADGSWCVGTGCLDDAGLQATWTSSTISTAVPEPAGCGLLATVVASMIVLRRRFDALALVPRPKSKRTSDCCA